MILDTIIERVHQRRTKGIRVMPQALEFASFLHEKAKTAETMVLVVALHYLSSEQDRRAYLDRFIHGIV